MVATGFVLLLTGPENSQATAGEDGDGEDEGGEDENTNIEKEKAYLMHATSGSGMQAIEVRYLEVGAGCVLGLTYVSMETSALSVPCSWQPHAC